jgi:hypothetical protein
VELYLHSLLRLYGVVFNLLIKHRDNFTLSLFYVCVVYLMAVPITYILLGDNVLEGM